MNDVMEVAKLSLLLERKLADSGIFEQQRMIVSEMPADLQEKMDGLIENAAELEGLLRIGQAARLGQALSPPVIDAARVMIEEVCHALFDREEFQAIRRVH